MLLVVTICIGWIILMLDGVGETMEMGSTWNYFLVLIQFQECLLQITSKTPEGVGVTVKCEGDVLVVTNSTSPSLNLSTLLRSGPEIVLMLLPGNFTLIPGDGLLRRCFLPSFCFFLGTDSLFGNFYTRTSSKFNSK